MGPSREDGEGGKREFWYRGEGFVVDGDGEAAAVAVFTEGERVLRAVESLVAGTLDVLTERCVIVSCLPSPLPDPVLVEEFSIATVLVNPVLPAPVLVEVALPVLA